MIIGVKTINITEKTGQLCGLKVVDGNEDIMIINNAGIIIRMNTAEISVFGRGTQGVRVMRVAEEIKVVCVAKVPKGVDEEEDGINPVDIETEQSDENQQAKQPEQENITEE